jgi:hypothetical protein
MGLAESWTLPSIRQAATCCSFGFIDTIICHRCSCPIHAASGLVFSNCATKSTKTSPPSSCKGQSADSLRYAETPFLDTVAAICIHHGHIYPTPMVGHGERASQEFRISIRLRKGFHSSRHCHAKRDSGGTSSPVHESWIPIW